MRPPLGRSAARTTCQAVARSGIRDQGRNSRWTSRPCSAARSHSPAKAAAASSRDHVPPKTSTALSERAPTASATANSSRSAKRKIRSSSCSGGMWIVGGAGEPPPGGVELGHRQAVIGQEQADVLVAQPFVAGHLVVAAPERNPGEAAGPGGRQPRPEGDARPERARAEHGVARAEGHRFARTGEAWPGRGGPLRTSASGHYRSLRVRERYRSRIRSTRDRCHVPRLVLRDATVLDADGARPRTTVVVEDRRIAHGSHRRTPWTPDPRTGWSSSAGAPSCRAW